VDDCTIEDVSDVLALRLAALLALNDDAEVLLRAAARDQLWDDDDDSVNELVRVFEVDEFAL
jgi:hypothetical protein